MNKFKKLQDDFANLSKTVDNNEKKKDIHEKAMAKIMPHHPKAGIVNGSSSVAITDTYERFVSDLLSGCSSTSHSKTVSQSLKAVELFVMGIDNRRVKYRTILSFNMFKNNHGGVIGKSERDMAQGLFGAESTVDENLLGQLAKHVRLIRAIIGMKRLNQAVANAWCDVNGKQDSLDDFEILGSAPLQVQQVLEEFAQWKQQHMENESTSGTQMPEPSSSTQGTSSSGFSLDDLLSNIIALFPQNSEIMSDGIIELLMSSKGDNELQGDLIDLVGFDHFELVGTLLEKRYQIVEACKQKTRQNASSSSQPAATPAYLQTVTVQNKSDADMRKEMRKEKKRVQREMNRIQNAFGAEENLEMELVQQEILRQKQLELDQMKWMPKVKGTFKQQEVYPFVFDARIEAGCTMMDINGMKFALPEGTTREVHRNHESVLVPPAKQGAVKDIRHVYIKDMDPLGQLGFQGFEKLNVIQSIVFEQAYKTKENLLICAPTGAGKTNIAMLTILNTIHEHTRPNGEIVKDDFKIVYIAPMKALATEMTESFGKRLAPLGLKVRELTGDTQLTKKELSETQMLVLTPEKWDVVTRKGTSDTSLALLVRLLIIDEVHLLNDERGPVIETLVARTLRQVEMSQTGIRIVGLSATLPNYIDVARFLRVNPYKGLFYFDGRFRPVPLTQKFIGVKKAPPRESMALMDDVCFDEVLKYVKNGHQVLVFVHTRNGTSKLAEFFASQAANTGNLDHFMPSDRTTRAYSQMEKTVQNCRNKAQLSNFFSRGFGIHHAGLVRQDRILMEKAFAQGHITVMFCTATLAWGVNLPAHAVVIKGTDVFDSEKGAFADLGVLDVQQIFGRAGRPQFENEGHGIIITSKDKLDKYLTMLIRQAPIESQFFKRLHDNLNAEISLGTVSTVDEAVEWLTYTYFYTRACQNPMAYGLQHNYLDKDPDLREHLSKIVTDVAMKLDTNQMIRFDTATQFLYATDLGRIASNFYVKYETIELLNEASKGIGLPVAFTGFMPDDQVIGLLSMSTEFSQLKIREEECQDLEELVSYGCMLRVRGGGLASVAGKVNVLLQSMISRTFIKSFSLQSEQLYVQQNASRLCRAMFEIVLRKGWAHATNAFLSMSKCIEKKTWPNQSPLRQLIEFEVVPVGWIDKVERRKLTEQQLLDLQPTELGHMFSCDGPRLFQALRYIPRMEVEAKFKPITYTIVQVEAILTPAFIWNERVLGRAGAQSFYLFLENINENLIMHQERVAINKVKVDRGEPQHIIFTIPIRDHQLTNNYQLRVVSEYFISLDGVYPLSMHNCVLPKSIKAHTDLLDLDPLPIKTLRNAKFESIYSYEYFNPIQTQIFHCLYKTDESALIGAPTGSGKTCCAELAMFRLLQDHPGKKVVYIAPLKALVRERVDDWKEKFEKMMGYRVVEVSGDVTPEASALSASSILITTPEKWDGISRSWATREYVRQVGLIVLDEVHLLGVDRGAVLEAIVTRIKMITRRSYTREEPARLVGLSTALANAGDVAEWLGIRDEGLFNFRPSVRPVPISVHIQGFPGQHYCPRMALMNKPAFKAIMTYSPTKPVLVFVASRRQTRLTAMAFVNHLVAESNPKQFLNMNIEELDDLLQTVRDENLKLTLPFGIGMHHAGLSQHERSLVEQLYLEKKIQVLIATATLAWGINCPAHLVIVKGTEFFDGKTGKYVDFPVTDVLQMMGRAGRPQFDTLAVAVIYVQDAKKTFYKKFLYEPFPVESSLLPVLANHVNAEITAGTIDSKQAMVEYISGTYLYRRLFANPNYYELEEANEQSVIDYITTVVDNVVTDLVDSKCIEVDPETKSLAPTAFGRLASVYYLKHETIRFLLEQIHESTSVIEMLRILTHVPEYAEVPVRHNEDVANGELQRNLRIRFPTAVLDSSHTKTHLLFQAHFARMQLQTDYRTDQKSVLDQCIRILQAMREICVLRNWLSPVLSVTILQQMIYSARWHDDHPLSVLPHLTESEIKQLGEDLTIPLIQDRWKLEQAKVDQKRAKKWLADKTIMEERQIDEVFTAIKSYPIVNLLDVRAKSESLLQKPISVKRGEVFRLNVDLQTVGPYRAHSEAYLPQWSKSKNVGWMVIVGNKETNQLLSVTYAPQVTGHKTLRLDLKVPDRSGPYSTTLFLFCDCYLGIDQEYDLEFNIE